MHSFTSLLQVSSSLFSSVEPILLFSFLLITSPLTVAFEPKLLMRLFNFLFLPSTLLKPLLIPDKLITMSSTTCSKCFAASEKCKTTKEHLKMSKTEVKKMEKTLVETEKELVQSRRKIAELRDQRKARANIQEEMAELKRQMAELMKEKEQEEAVHQKLTEEVAKAKESQPMSAAERREMIFDIKDKIGMSEGVHIAAIEQIFR